MRTFLDRMRDLKNQEILQRSADEPLEALREKALDGQCPSNFAEAVKDKGNGLLEIIAEVKARAPGRVNVESLDPITVVREYAQGGAAAVSVLTDQNWFGGNLDTLSEVSENTDLPLLHKEFIVSEYQLLEGRLRGASASLLLAYYFDQKELKEMMEHCHRWQLEPVVECSLEEELPRALEANPKILMINNRPIAAIPEEPSKTYQQGSVEVTLDWWDKYEEIREWKEQPGKILISASCIDEPYHVQRLMEIPCDACLVGNSAMTAEDRVSHLKSLRKGS